VLIIVPGSALLDQWAVSLQEELGVSPDDIALFGSGKRPEPARFNIVVINTARELAADLSTKFPLFLIVDECHRAGSLENAKALRGTYIATLGLSATPERPYDEGLLGLLVPALGPIIYRYGLEQARKDGVITPFDLQNVQINLLSDEQEKYNKITREITRKMRGQRLGECVPDNVKVLLQKRARVSALAAVRVPVAVKLAEMHRGARTIIFHEDIGEADKIVQMLKKRNHSVTAYHTRIGGPLRRNNLIQYRRGVYDVLVCCRALDEGVNIPETRIAVIASATAASRQRIQRLGRVLRPAPGKDRAIVYTLFATKAERQRLENEAIALTDTATVSWFEVKMPHE
jgi:superfamily II DNA or RNA helicase